MMTDIDWQVLRFMVGFMFAVSVMRLLRGPYRPRRGGE